MWERFKRMVKSNVGRLADGLGSADPLKADLKELEKELPRLQKALAELRGEVAVQEDRERKKKVERKRIYALEGNMHRIQAKKQERGQKRKHDD